MKKIKKGDIVARKSYGKDIIFYVKRLVKTSNEDIAILCGLFERIEADSKLEDLELLDDKTLKTLFDNEEKRFNSRITEKNNEYRFNFINEDSNLREKFITGKILHLDGDKRYSQKSYNYYKKVRFKCYCKKYSRIQATTCCI